MTLTLEQLKARYWSMIETGYLCIPNLIMFDERLSRGALKLYCLIRFFEFQKGESFPGENLLAQIMNRKIRMIRNYKKELKKTRWLTWTYRGKHCLYRTSIPALCKLSKESKLASQPKVHYNGVVSLKEALAKRFIFAAGS